MQVLRKWNVILCVDQNNIIGHDKKVPWDFPLNRWYFKTITSWDGKNLLVHGKNTEMNVKDANRDTFVLDGKNFDDIDVNAYNHVFICGGAKTYTSFTRWAEIHGIEYTIFKNFVQSEIKKTEAFVYYDAYPRLSDVKYPNIVDGICFSVFINGKEVVNNDPYIKILRELVDKNLMRVTRNSHTTVSDFHNSVSYDLREGFPVPSKSLFWRGVCEELFFFLRGDTDTKKLSEKNIKIWEGNTANTNGEMGPMYGYQWRNFGGSGYDQLLKVIESLKTDPYSRRHIMTTFNPVDADKGVLYPCHGIVVQFYIDDEGFLSLAIYQRSADVFLGLPFNIASYALLLTLIGAEIGRPVKKMHIDLGDYHIYSNHIEVAKKQLTLPPVERGVLRIKNHKKIDNYNYGDIELIFKSICVLKADMNV